MLQGCFRRRKVYLTEKQFLVLDLLTGGAIGMEAAHGQACVGLDENRGPEHGGLVLLQLQHGRMPLVSTL